MGYDSLDLGYDLHYDTEVLGTPSRSHAPALSSSQELPQVVYRMGPPSPVRGGTGIPFVDNSVSPAPQGASGGAEDASDEVDPFGSDAFEEGDPAQSSGAASAEPGAAARRKAEAAYSTVYDQAIAAGIPETDARAMAQKAGEDVLKAETNKPRGGGRTKRGRGAKGAKEVMAAPPVSPAKLRFLETLRSKGITDSKVQDLILKARPLPSAKASVAESEAYYSQLSRASQTELLSEARETDAKLWLDHHRKQGVSPQTAYHNAMARGLLPEGTTIPEAWPPAKKPVLEKGAVDFSKIERSQADMATSVAALQARPAQAGGPADAEAAAKRNTTQVNVTAGYVRLAQERYQIPPEESEKRLAAMGYGPRDDFDPQAAASALFTLKSGVQGEVLVTGETEGSANFGEWVLADSQNLDPVVPRVTIPNQGEFPLSSPEVKAYSQQNGIGSLQGANPMGVLALRQEEEQRLAGSLSHLGTETAPQGMGLEKSEWDAMLNSDVYGSPPLFDADGNYIGKDEGGLRRLRALEKQVQDERRLTYGDSQEAKKASAEELATKQRAWREEKFGEARDYHRNQMFGHMHRFGLDRETVGAWMSSAGYLGESPDLAAMAEDNQRFAAIATDDKTAIAELKRDILAEKGNASAPVSGDEAVVLSAFDAANSSDGAAGKGGKESDLADQKEMAKFEADLREKSEIAAEKRQEAMQIRLKALDHKNAKEMTSLQGGWQAMQGLLQTLSQLMLGAVQAQQQLLGAQTAVSNQTLQTILAGLYGPGQAGARR